MICEMKREKNHPLPKSSVANSQRIDGTKPIPYSKRHSIPGALCGTEEQLDFVGDLTYQLKHISEKWRGHLGMPRRIMQLPTRYRQVHQMEADFQFKVDWSIWRRPKASHELYDRAWEDGTRRHRRKGKREMKWNKSPHVITKRGFHG
jgi:hypothetical protein